MELTKVQRRIDFEKEPTAASDVLLPYPLVFLGSGIQRLGQYITPILLLIVDYLTIVSALWSAFWIRSSVLPIIFPQLPFFSFSSSYLFFVIPFSYLILFFYEHLYEKRLPFWQNTEKIFKTCFFATVISIGFMYFSNTAKDISRIFVAVSGCIAFIYLIISRYMFKRLMMLVGIWQKPAILVGHRNSFELLAKMFTDEPTMGYQIVGMITDDTGLTLKHKHPIIGSFSTIKDTIKTCKVKNVIIATPGLKGDEILKLIETIHPLVNELAILPDLPGVPLSNIEIENFFNQQTVLLKIKNNLSVPFNCIIKRFLDIVLGSIISIVALPLMFLISILIRVDSPGPAIYVAKRLGRKGKEFNCYKFRTMYLNNEQIFQAFLEENPDARDEWKKYAKIKKEDPRVTRLGRFLRKTSLDELPQIFNVLKGEMSLVGPRPYLPRESERMGYSAGTILEATPGITGLWQVCGRNDIDFEGRLQLDCWYVRNWSVWLDLTLLVKTVGVVLNRKGAY